jgi:hypothetical protein
MALVMAGRGPQTFAKRRKEQRREAEKQARWLLPKHESRPEENAGAWRDAAHSEQPDSFDHA